MITFDFPITSQVTLEEQMICGALQTLNEEAFEDVLGSERPSPTNGPSGEPLAQQEMNSITPNHSSHTQAGKSQLTPIKESTEQHQLPRSPGAVQRTTSGFVSGFISGITERYTNRSHNNHIINNHIPNHSNIVNSYAIANHLDDTAMPTVIVMPSSLENIHINDDTRL